MTEGQAPHNKIWEQIHQSMDWGLEPDLLLDFFIKEYFPDAAGKQALDIGCGRGASSLLLAKAGFRVISIDVSPTALKKLHELITDDLNITPLLTDVTVTEFLPNSFDLIVDTMSLSLLPEPAIAAVIEKAKDWLKPGGWIFSKLAAAPFDPTLIRAPLYLVDENFIRKAFAGMANATYFINAHVLKDKLTTSYWLVTARKD